MKLSRKILTSMLLTAAVSVGIAGAQDINADNGKGLQGKSFGGVEKMHDLKAKIDALSAEVKAQLKAAREAGDLLKVRSILLANGITMPKLEKKIGKKIEKFEKKLHKGTEGKGHRINIKNLPDSVRAELKAAFEAKDMAKVKSILAANGIGGHGKQGSAAEEAKETADEKAAEVTGK